MNTIQLANDIKLSVPLARSYVARGMVEYSRIAMVESVRCATPQREDHPYAYFAPVPVSRVDAESLPWIACIIDVEASPEIPAWVSQSYDMGA